MTTCMITIETTETETILLINGWRARLQPNGAGEAHGRRIYCPANRLPSSWPTREACVDALRRAGFNVVDGNVVTTAE